MMLLGDVFWILFKELRNIPWFTSHLRSSNHTRCSRQHLAWAGGWRAQKGSSSATIPGGLWAMVPWKPIFSFSISVARPSLVLLFSSYLVWSISGHWSKESLSQPEPTGNCSPWKWLPRHRLAMPTSLKRWWKVRQAGWSYSGWRQWSMQWPLSRALLTIKSI